MKEITIRPVGEAAPLAVFLAAINRDHGRHIGYCGAEPEEIRHTLEGDFSDFGLARSFWVAEREGRIIGALGLDADSEEGSAEVWGPFVASGQPFREVAAALWHTAMDPAGETISRFDFFVNEENTDAAIFIDRLGAEKTGHHLILGADGAAQLPAEHPAVPFSPAYEEAFIRLHDETFPGTYYSGADILSRLDGRNGLLVIPDGEDRIRGYVYVEADPIHGDGSIEFLAVSPDHRRQGLATRLLEAGLAELLNHDQIDEIRLTVEAENEAALGLYEAAGFRTIHRMTAWRLEEAGK
ncbi:GNAT family N-acetyltransferase [Bhargavaea cecembensis]|uniref:GNAT family N-acetyltransferase n=1 Tax=Bhargavaea cecembensis TaxID=394098 RepID=UPI00069494F1|nr:N-acetyltransferase [Bhargavaea cecembensis]